MSSKFRVGSHKTHACLTYNLTKPYVKRSSPSFKVVIHLLNERLFCKIDAVSLDLEIVVSHTILLFVTSKNSTAQNSLKQCLLLIPTQSLPIHCSGPSKL